MSVVQSIEEVQSIANQIPAGARLNLSSELTTKILSAMDASFRAKQTPPKLGLLGILDSLSQDPANEPTIRAIGDRALKLAAQTLIDHGAAAANTCQWPQVAVYATAKLLGQRTDSELVAATISREGVSN